ncbi:hypothetical protein JMUB7512_27820 [Staphylococcus aureus]
MLTKPQFDLVKKEVGIDRILYAADYPYIEPEKLGVFLDKLGLTCLLYTSPSPRDYAASRMPSSA